MSDSTSAKLVGDKQKLLRGSILMTLQPVTSFLLGILILMLISDFIPTEVYGIFSWFNIMNSFLGTLILFRLPMAVSRYTAVAKGYNDQEELTRLLKTNTLLTLSLVPLSGVVALFTTPFVFNVFVGIGGQYSLIDIVVFVLGVMCLNLSTLSISICKGLQEFEKIGITKFVSNTIGQITVIILIVWGVGASIITQLSALIFKWVIVGLFTIVLLSLTVRRIWQLKGSTYPLRPLIKYAYPAILSFIFAYLFREFLIRVLFQAYGSDLGLYQFAVQMQTFVNALTLGFYGALDAYYSRAVGRGGIKTLEGEVQWTIKISFFLFLPLIVGVIIVSPVVFLLLFEEYYWSYQYFVVLMVQIFFYLFEKPFHKILNAMAKTTQVLVISVISSITSGMLMILASQYGVALVLSGYVSSVFLLVVTGYVSSVFFSSLLAGLWIKRSMGISLGVRRVLPLVLIAVLMIVPAALIHLLRLSPLIEVGVILCVCALIYFLPIRFFKLVSENEIRKATLFLPRRLAMPLADALVRIFVRKPRE